MNGTTTRPDPSPSHKVVKKNVGRHEFTAGFYPGFARTITVNGDDVYDQERDGPYPFVLPNGDEKPWKKSEIEISSTKGYSFTITVDDPDHVIDKIEVTMKASAGGGVVAYSGDTEPDPDTITVSNTALLCPPNC
ncbi:MAG TPA: hypothetical protein VF771_12565 [Longimicrobiaceae bacterium]